MAETEEVRSPTSNKRALSDVEGEAHENGTSVRSSYHATVDFELHSDRTPTGDESDSEDDFGPALPSAVAPKKKRRKLAFEKVYVNALPASPRYSKSLMHKDQLSFVTVTPHTDFLVTSSVDGVVKFWKKLAVGIEFVKEFRAHTAEIRSVSVSADGRSFATAGADKTVKIFDVITFGMSTGGDVSIRRFILTDFRSPGDVPAQLYSALFMLGTSTGRIPTYACCHRRIQ